MNLLMSVFFTFQVGQSFLQVRLKELDLLLDRLHPNPPSPLSVHLIELKIQMTRRILSQMPRIILLTWPQTVLL